MADTSYQWLTGNTLVFVGDSITADGRSNYITLVISSISAHVNAAGIKIVNAGVDSSSVVEAMDRLPDIILEHDPDVCVFFLGVNDSKIFRSTGKPLLSVDVFETCYAHLLDASDNRRKRTNVILTIPPLLFDEIKAERLLADYWYWNPGDYDKYNDVILRLARQNNCLLADVAASFRADETGLRLFTSDGVHPNIYGHQLIAKALLDVLKQAPR